VITPAHFVRLGEDNPHHARYQQFRGMLFAYLRQARGRQSALATHLRVNRQTASRWFASRRPPHQPGQPSRQRLAPQPDHRRGTNPPSLPSKSAWGETCKTTADAPHTHTTVSYMKVLVPPQSGSKEGITASRNRFGQYIRTRAIPVNPASFAQGAVRARMAGNSAAYRLLTSAQRAGWSDLGLMMTRSDSLGQSYALQGNQAYASINNNNLAAGAAVVADAPAIATTGGPRHGHHHTIGGRVQHRLHCDATASPHVFAGVCLTTTKRRP